MQDSRNCVKLLLVIAILVFVTGTLFMGAMYYISARNVASNPNVVANSNFYDYSKCNKPVAFFNFPFKRDVENPIISTMAYFISDNCWFFDYGSADYFACVYDGYYLWREDNTIYKASNTLKSVEDYVRTGEGDCSERALVLSSLFVNLGFDAYYVVSSDRYDTWHAHTIVYYNNTVYEFDIFEETDYLVFMLSNKVSYRCYEKAFDAEILKSIVRGFFV